MSNVSFNDVNLNSFMSQKSDGIFYVGHASCIVKISGKNYLFDYLIDSKPYGDMWRFFPELQKNIDVNNLDGIFVSHMHQDHMDIPFLKKICNRVKVYIILGRPSFEKLLENNEIKYIGIPPYQKFEIDLGIIVYGVLHESNGIDASCYIGNESFSVYHGNDNYCGNESLSCIAKEFGKIDIACIPFSYINWYPQLLENLTQNEKDEESRRLVNHYFEYAIMQAEILNAQQVIPFGANLIYFDDAYSALNLESATPLDFESYIINTRGAKFASRFKALFTGDFIINDTKGLILHSNHLYKKDSYRSVMADYINNLKKNDNRKSIQFNKNIKDKVSNYDLSFPQKEESYLVVQYMAGNKSRVINLQTGEVMDDTKSRFGTKATMHIINIMDEDLYWGWAAGFLRLEEVIGMRRFTLRREPNVYSPAILKTILNDL